MLADIGKLPTHEASVGKEKNIVVFIYTNVSVLNLMKRHTKGKRAYKSCSYPFFHQHFDLKKHSLAMGCIADYVCFKEMERKFLLQTN